MDKKILIEKLEELNSLDNGGNWRFLPEEEEEENSEYVPASVGFICSWGGVHVLNIMKGETTDATEHAKFIAELHNLLPDIIKHLNT